MNCPRCTTTLLPDAAFCDFCGLNLAEAAAAPAGARCATCGSETLPGSLFCQNCGAELNQPAPPVSPAPPISPAPPVSPAPPAWQQPVQSWQPEPPQQQPQPQPWQSWQPAAYPPVSIPGRLIVVNANMMLPIPPSRAEVIIGRVDPISGIVPDIDLNPYDALNQGVSRMHAKIAMQGGQVVIEDLNAANFTTLRGMRLIPGQKYPLNHGDELVLGRLRLVYYAG